MIIIMGSQGSGKGTQAKLLADKRGALHLSTGALLRQSTDPSIKQDLNYGRLADTKAVLQILEQELARLAPRQEVIFDGSPRTLPEAKALQHMLSKRGKNINRVVFLDIPESESISRLLKRGRSDDNAPAITERLKEFKTITLPAVNYFEQQGLLKVVNGTGSVEDVAKRVEEAVANAS